MNPYALIEQAEDSGKLPKPVLRRIRSRTRHVEGAVRRVERASGLSYPSYFVEPVLPLVKSGVEFGDMGVLYARIIPTTLVGSLTILVQFTAALVAFGSKGTIEAVAAHEFTHYMDLVRRFSRMNVVSDESFTTLFESAYADAGRTVSPKLIFKDKALVSLLGRKFKEGLVDDRLNETVRKKWIGKGLPVRVIASDENVARVEISSVLSTSFDPEVLKRIAALEGKSKR